jgi:putative DNA primase/helicase
MENQMKTTETPTNPKNSFLKLVASNNLNIGSNTETLVQALATDCQLGNSSSLVEQKTVDQVRDRDNPHHHLGSKNELPEGYVLRRDGIYSFNQTDDDGDAEEVWLCSPLKVVALARDVAGKNWSSIVELVDQDAKEHKLTIPHRDFSGTAPKARYELQDVGAELSANPKAIKQFAKLLMSWKPMRRITLTMQLGWTDDTFKSFALGNKQVIGDQDFMFHPVHSNQVAAAIRQKGTSESWRYEVGSLCAKNVMLIAAVSLAFSGPLLEPMRLQGSGLHLRGASSRGKSTALQAAVSVWGGGDFQQSWRTTTNGLEGVATACNGTLLALDEMGEVLSKDLSDAIYMLGNGQGKGRGNAQGRTTGKGRWKVAMLSTGEVSVADKLAEAGKAPMAGHEVRLIDIDADSRQFGVFDYLHDAPNAAAFADQLKRATTDNFGCVGVAFVEHLLLGPNNVFVEVEKAIGDFCEHANTKLDLPQDGQIQRVLKTFALIAAAGDLATEFGLTGWPKQSASEAAMTLLAGWLAERDAPSNAENEAAALRVQKFLNSDQQLLIGDCSGKVSRKALEDCSDWRGDGHYYLSTATWVRIHHGFDPRDSARKLKSLGLLLGADGENLMKRAPGKFEDRPRFYTLRDEIMQRISSV